MSNVTPVTKCPKCGYTGIELAAFTKAKPTDKLPCPNCGAISTKKQFVADVLNDK